jgi:hypothetical protein
MTRLTRIPPRRLAVLTVGNPVDVWASIAVQVLAMTFEFILPFLRPIGPFFAGPQTVLVQAHASPAAYESSYAKQFSHIHFFCAWDPEWFDCDTSFVGFVIATEINLDQPSAAAPCNDLSNFANRRVSSLARKSTHLKHQRDINCGFKVD